VNLSPRIVSAETFTVIHGGAEIDESRSRELLDLVHRASALYSENKLQGPEGIP
jgi:hypothetical protein